MAWGACILLGLAANAFAGEQVSVVTQDNRLVQFDAGIHGYSAAEQGLPMGVAPVGALLWHEAIQGGYFKPAGR